MAEHRFDYLSDFCMDCGIAAFKALELRSVACPGGDSRTYLIARHRLNALVDPVLKKLGFKEPERPN